MSNEYWPITNNCWFERWRSNKNNTSEVKEFCAIFFLELAQMHTSTLNLKIQFNLCAYAYVLLSYAFVCASRVWHIASLCDKYSSANRFCWGNHECGTACNIFFCCLFSSSIHSFRICEPFYIFSFRFYSHDGVVGGRWCLAYVTLLLYKCWKLREMAHATVLFRIRARALREREIDSISIFVEFMPCNLCIGYWCVMCSSLFPFSRTHE